MQELQSEDFFIPRFLLMLPPQPEASQRDMPSEDFLEGIQGWAEYYSVDDCAE